MQDYKYTTVEGDQEELDREGDQEKENYDTEGGAETSSTSKRSSAALHLEISELISWADGLMGWPMREGEYRALYRESQA